MSSDQSFEGIILANGSVHTSSNSKRTGGKLHERLLTNIRLQKWGKNRRIHSVHCEELPRSLQKCYSTDENILQSQITISDLNDEDIIFEEHCIVPNINIRAATVERIIEELLTYLDENVSFDELISPENIVFPKIFFLVHNWFSNSEAVGRILFQFTDIGKDHTFPNGNFNISLNNGKRFRADTVTLAFCLWIELYPNDFMGSESCMPILTEFIEFLHEADRDDLTTTLEKCLNSSYDWSRGLSMKMSIRRPIPTAIKLTSGTETSSLVFNQIQPTKLAEQLTVIEFKAFRRITILDLKMYSITGTVQDIPRLERSVYLFNGLSQWVQCMILNRTTPQERAKVVEKFLQIAKHLLILQNFNTFYAVIGGITHSSISRLTATMASLSTTGHKMLEEFTKVISSTNNFSNYRQLQKEAKGVHIPVLAVHLKDLIFYNTALPDYLDKSYLINFRKFAQLASTLHSILDQQLMQLNIEQNIDLCNTLRLSLDLQYSEEEIYELSLAREPKSLGDHQANSPISNKSVLFAEFVSGVKPPTPDVLTQHVNGMVDAVFKVYDNDKDGLISSEEFELVAENFPFIDSFAVLDADNDGVISKSEMKMYFLKANYNVLKNSFKHNFYENTYFKPTFCAHCTGLLWGLIKQGWRCKDCGLNAHKHCKDQVVMECRSRTVTFQHYRSPSQSTEGGSYIQPVGSPLCQSRQITIDQKRKMSQRRKHMMIVNAETQTAEERNEIFTHDDISYIDMDSNNMSLSSGMDEESTDVFFNKADSINELEKSDNYKKENKNLQDNIAILEDKLKIQSEQIQQLQNALFEMRQKTASFIFDIISIFHQSS